MCITSGRTSTEIIEIYYIKMKCILVIPYWFNFQLVSIRDGSSIIAFHLVVKRVSHVFLFDGLLTSGTSAFCKLTNNKLCGLLQRKENKSQDTSYSFFTLGSNQLLQTIMFSDRINSFNFLMTCFCKQITFFVYLLSLCLNPSIGTYIGVGKINSDRLNRYLSHITCKLTIIQWTLFMDRDKVEPMIMCIVCRRPILLHGC